jgi:small GTP-binding protein
MTYATEKIRNIALLGHGSSGKTSLAESMLYLTGGTDRLGKIVDGNTVGDSEAEEIKRQISISLATMVAEYKDTKINIFDTPGYFDFAGEVNEALRVADAGIIVTAAKDVITVGFEKSWKYLEGLKLPRAVFVSKVDEENGNYEAVYSALREKYGTSVCPMIAPIKSAAGKVEGLIDLINRKAFSMDGGKTKEIPIPDGMKAELEELYTAVTRVSPRPSEDLMKSISPVSSSPSRRSSAVLKSASRREHYILFSAAAHSPASARCPFWMRWSVCSRRRPKVGRKQRPRAKPSPPIPTARPAPLCIKPFRTNMANSACSRCSR